MHPELRWTLVSACAATAFASVLGLGWLEHRSQQAEFSRVRARLEVQARELTATRSELERLSHLLALDLAGTRTVERAAFAGPADFRPAPNEPQQQPVPSNVPLLAAQPNPVELEALKAASSVLRDALSAGRWTAASSLRFREQLANVAEDDKAALMTELTTAINTDKLRLDGAPAPF